MSAKGVINIVFNQFYLLAQFPHSAISCVFIWCHNFTHYHILVSLFPWWERSQTKCLEKSGQSLTINVLLIDDEDTLIMFNSIWHISFKITIKTITRIYNEVLIWKHWPAPCEIEFMKGFSRLTIQLYYHYLACPLQCPLVLTLGHQKIRISQ